MTRFHQVELGRERCSTIALSRSLEALMNIEQPALGCVGVDSFTLALDWHWEGGYTLRSSSRLSGSTEWTQHAYESLSSDEALEMVQMIAAELLGLL